MGEHDYNLIVEEYDERREAFSENRNMRKEQVKELLYEISNILESNICCGEYALTPSERERMIARKIREISDKL